MCRDRDNTGHGRKLDGYEMHFNDDNHGGSGGRLTKVGGKIKRKIWQLSVIFL